MNEQKPAMLEVQIQPGASSDRVVAYENGVLRVRVSAPPVEGKANTKLVEFLSKILDIPRSSIVITRGHTGRHKFIRINSLTGAQLKEKLEIYLGKHGN